MFGSGLRLRLAGVVVAAATLAASAGAAGPGALDPTFGTNGVVMTDFGPFRDEVSALAIQPDGKIVAAGTSNTYAGGAFALARYNADGSLDRSFGTGGKVTSGVGPGPATVGAVLLLPDGKILVAGSAFVRTPDGDYPDGIALVRYLSDGSPDTSFGDQGLVRPQLEDVGAINDAVLQPDEKIVLGGRGSTEHTFSTGFGLVRLNSDGSPDLSFGTNGEVTNDFGGLCVVCDVNAVALQPDGRIVAAGLTIYPRSLPVVAFARYTEDGTLEAGFGSAGSLPELNGEADDVAIQPDGKILLVGGTIDHGLLVERILRNGSVDQSFAGPAGSLAGYASAVALQPDGKIVVAGGAGAAFAVARFTSTGSLDPTFGTHGLAQYPKPVVSEALALQPDQKILVAGYAVRSAGDWDFSLARFLGTGGGVYCLVPNVVGLSRAGASRRITKAHCRTGKVSTRRSAKPRGRVLAQSPKPRTELAAGARVSLVVSRGRT